MRVSAGIFVFFVKSVMTTRTSKKRKASAFLFLFYYSALFFTQHTLHAVHDRFQHILRGAFFSL